MHMTTTHKHEFNLNHELRPDLSTCLRVQIYHMQRVEYHEYVSIIPVKEVYKQQWLAFE